jgi:hypothetical protein
MTDHLRRAMDWLLTQECLGRPYDLKFYLELGNFDGSETYVIWRREYNDRWAKSLPSSALDPNSDEYKMGALVACGTIGPRVAAQILPVIPRAVDEADDCVILRSPGAARLLRFAA